MKKIKNIKNIKSKVLTFYEKKAPYIDPILVLLGLFLLVLPLIIMY